MFVRKLCPVVAITLTAALATGCERRVRSAPPSGATLMQSPEPTPEPPPAVDALQVPAGEVVRVEMSGDQPVYAAHAPKTDRRAIVFLQGKCSNGRKDIDEVAALAPHVGTLIAVLADTPCPDGSRRWTLDVDAIHTRVMDGLRAVAEARDGALDIDQVVLVGESQGASRAELLVAKHPDRYGRVVLIGGPTPADVDRFVEARAVATVAGEKEQRELMQDSARDLESAGRRARYFELPGAVHGSWGDDGPRVLREALDFVRAAP